MDKIRLIFIGNIIDKMTVEIIKEFLYNEGNITVVDSVDAVDVKVGYCFVKCVDDGELDEKIHRVNGLSIPGFEDKKLTVEFTKTNLDEQKKREERKKAFVKPTDTLFVVGFDPTKIKPHYLEHEFESVAKVKRVELVKSFAYCYFYSIEDAIAVKEAFEDKEFFGKKLHMEFKQYSRKDTRNEEVLPYDPRPIARDFYPHPIPVPTYRGRSRDREYRDPRDDRPILRLPPPPLYVRYDVPRRSRSRSRDRGRPTQPYDYPPEVNSRYRLPPRDYIPPPREHIPPRDHIPARDQIPRVHVPRQYSRYEPLAHEPMDIPTNRRRDKSRSNS